jgi:thiamine pyrophosphate-dependent acetolactate synthase large subunit-like protein
VNGDQAIARILKAEGVEWLGAFPYQTLIDAAAMEGLRPIICRQERAGVNMADGFSRITNGRTFGVFTMQRGPGAENAFGGVAQAYADSIPMLMLPGGAPLGRNQVHPNFDAVPHYQGITKWSAQINTVERIPEMMRRAFSQMSHGRPGPVLLEIPQDIALQDFPDEDFSYRPVERFRSAADPDDVRNLVEALLRASCPVINAGHGILWAEATDVLIELADLANLPVLTTLAGKSAFPEDHPLALGTGGHTGTLMVDHFLKKTDFVLGIGTSFTRSAFCAPMPDVTLAQVTNCVDDLHKDYQISYGAIGDARIVIRQIIEEVRRQTGKHAPGNGNGSGLVAEVAEVRQRFNAEWNPLFRSDETPISPYRVFHELAAAVDVGNTIITHDSGYPRDQLAPFWPCVSPRSYLGWGKSTQLGYGLGLAMGAKLAAPDKQVINVMGDAAFGMSGLDLETAVRAGIPILTVVLNNGVMTGYDQHMPYATENHSSDALGGNYAAVAAGLGAWSRRVEAPDGLAPAIGAALAANRNGVPALIEAITKVEKNVPKFW